MFRLVRNVKQATRRPPENAGNRHRRHEPFLPAARFHFANEPGRKSPSRKPSDDIEQDHDQQPGDQQTLTGGRPQPNGQGHTSRKIPQEYKNRVA